MKACSSHRTLLSPHYLTTSQQTIHNTFNPCFRAQCLNNTHLPSDVQSEVYLRIEPCVTCNCVPFPSTLQALILNTAGSHAHPTPGHVNRTETSSIFVIRQRIRYRHHERRFIVFINPQNGPSCVPCCGPPYCHRHLLPRLGRHGTRLVGCC